MMPNRREFLILLAASATAANSCGRSSRQTLHVVPNFHPACMGWLAPYYVERNYCLYSYLDHQDRALQDPDYRYVLSEIPHLITMIERHPERLTQLQELVKQGKTEMVNAFVLEPTINLSSGETLVMQGVEGLRWYRQIMGLRPRHCWMIDVCGWHEQMAQIVKGLGLDTFVYSRYNPTCSADSPHGIAKDMDAIHWLESPDGSRTLAVNPCHYSDALRKSMSATEALPPQEVLQEVGDLVKQQRSRFPDGAPLLAFAGQGDYALPFYYKGYPAEMLKIWRDSNPGVELRFSTLSQWYDRFYPRVNQFNLKTVKSGSRIYGWSGFWVNSPLVKQWYRRCEHLLQASEALNTVASLKGGSTYQSQPISDAWLLMALNMDRNLLWAAGVHATYEHRRSWDMSDRFETVEDACRRCADTAFRAVAKPATDSLALFNPASWKRNGPLELQLPPGRTLAEGAAQFLEDGTTALVQAELPAFGITSIALKAGRPQLPQPVLLREAIETDFYSARIDGKTGALVSLKLKPSGREIFAGPANTVTAEVRSKEDQKQVFAHEIPRREARVVVFTSDNKPSKVKVSVGSLAAIVETAGPFHGGALRRVIRFHKRSPRIDFLTETNDLPHGTIVTALFPLAGDVTEVRRAIPYGFAHCAWSKANAGLPGQNQGIVPVIRWSHYSLAGGGGSALLDRGIPGRELVEKTAIILLHNATTEYYWDKNSKWTSGEGTQRFEYAFVAHDGDWKDARVPQMAWEYNAVPLVFAGSLNVPAGLFVETSGNLIVEALRRTGDEIEIRAVECFGIAGDATIRVTLPHTSAALTNMMGEQPVTLASRSRQGDGAEYQFAVRPQQIMTLRLKTNDSAPAVQALRTFDPVVPEAKRAATRNGFDHPELKGHPPRKPGEEKLFMDLEEKS